MKLEITLIDVVSILIGVIGIYIAIKTKREQWQIAEKSGAFHKPRIRLAVFEYKLGNGYPDNEDWCFVHPGDLDDYAIFPVKFRIFNDGDNITEEILISIQTPKLIFSDSQLDNPAITTYPSLMNERIQQSVDQVGNFTVISVALPPLSPKSSFDLILPFAFRPTSQDMSIPVEVEKRILEAQVEVIYFNSISITIFSGNLKPSSYRVRIGAISAPTIVDSIKKYTAFKPYPKKKSILKRISNPFKNITELKVTNFIAFDIEKQSRYDKHRVFWMKLPSYFHRGGWFNLPSSDFTELANLPTGAVVGFIEFEEIPRSQRRFRFKKGNLIEEK